MIDDNLKKVGLKTTAARIKILSILTDAKPRHMSAEDVYNQLTELGEEVSLATVYRVLTQFEAVELVKRHNFENDRAVFEIDEGDHHDHLVCLKCGLVSEFVDEVIEKRQKKIATAAGFKMTDHSLTIYGLCVGCG